MGKGALFKKADLHIHVPGTGQYFQSPEQINVNSDREREKFAERVVKYSKEEAGLDMIAITNHNDASWVEPMHKAANRLFPDSFFVFPGVEIGTQSGKDGVHVLSVFEVGTTQEEIDHFMISLELLKDDRFDKHKSPNNTKLSFREVLEKIEHHDGIAIAPHVFSDNGLLESSRKRQRINNFTDPKLLGVDFQSSIDELGEEQRNILENRDPNLDFRRKNQIACLNNSDARRIEDIGTWFTWIKCEEVNIETLKQSLLDPEARLRLRDNPPQEPNFQIQNINVKSDNKTGFLYGIDIQFNPRINCLIGGRGTGKSALIELLRYVWQQAPVSEREEEVESFRPVFLPESGKASVGIKSRQSSKNAWQEYQIEKEGTKKPEVYRINDKGDKILDSDLEPNDIFPVRVFGQKEILYTSKDIGSQLEMLDRMIGDELERIDNKIEEIDLKLRRNRETFVNLLIEIDQMDEQLSRLGKIKVKLEQYRQAGLEELEKTRRFYEREAGLWETAERQLSNVEEQLGMVESSFDFNLSYLSEEQLYDVDEIGKSSEESKRLPNEELFRELRDKLRLLREELLSKEENIYQLINRTKEEILEGKSKWENTKEAFDEKYYDKLREVGSDEFDMDSLLQLERERVHLERVKREREDLLLKLKEIASERTDLLTQREEIIDNRFQIRNKWAQKLTKRLRPKSEELNPRIKIEVVKSGDQTKWVDELQEYLTGSRLWKQDYEAIAENSYNSKLGFLSSIENAIEGKEEDVFIYEKWKDDFIKNEESELNDDMEKFANSCDIEVGKARKLVNFLGWEELLKLDEFIIPDRILVKINVASDIRASHDSDRPIWRTLGKELGEGVSVGQGCTAILSIIFLEAENPLIIDQPEDDLDNRFIYDEIVQVLRRERGHRQLIIATHNANIPVAGDAELILALGVEEMEVSDDKTTLHGVVEDSGFIDSKNMRKIVSETLEGGEQAFWIRKQKYGF